MTRRLTLAALVLFLAACATPTPPQPATTLPTTTLPPPSSTVAASTTTIAQPSAVTGTGPESFTTRTVPGDVQVIIVRVVCAGGPGDGWKVTWRITNQGEARVGAVLAKVDEDGAEAVFVPTLSLRAGQSVEATQVIKASGDSVTVTWANADRPVRSFPMDAPTCVGKS